MLSKQLRDSATSIANADIARRQNSADLNQQLTGNIGQSPSGYTLPVGHGELAKEGASVWVS